MSQTILQKNIADILGIAELPLEEQAAFLSEVGDVIFETSLMRLITSLSPEQQIALEQYVETDPEPDVLLQYLLDTYSDFKNILEEAVITFKEDALSVLQEKSESDIQIVDPQEGK